MLLLLILPRIVSMSCIGMETRNPRASLFTKDRRRGYEERTIERVRKGERSDERASNPVGTGLSRAPGNNYQAAMSDHKVP